ncbi:MAG: RNA-binding transcriptional accessory protein [Gammaproteobacteria bacterium]|nr:RNA-binding transcriptional accessory protein [Gammaproteobacteria bacterium]
MSAAIESRIAAELGVKPQQIIATVALIDEGATVPFIARYRKEVTGGLDDTQLRTIDERLAYLRELEQRREVILKSIDEQQKLTPELKAAIEAADTKQRLEDLYLPYKPKRRTKAQIAREAGLEPLADALLANPDLDPEQQAQDYIIAPFTTDHGDNPGVADAAAALEGARQILTERFAEDAELLAKLRAHLTSCAVVVASVAEGKENEGAKFRDYFDHREPYANVPSHRALAMFRGRKEEILRLALKLPEELETTSTRTGNSCESIIAAHYHITQGSRPGDAWLTQTVRWAWQVKLAWQLESEFFLALREQAEHEAIDVFARNLKDVLLAAPAGPRVTMGLDPGIRTGVKVAVVDQTGKVLDTATIYPHEPKRDWNGSLHTLAGLVIKHQIELIGIGNGTASRETDRLAADLLKLLPADKVARKPIKIVVSEAGASVYSASALAAKELAQLDVTLRGAVSIARRLQDPLAELVKIEPKSVGVGQYQHDVNQSRLARQLDAVVEDCVNAVGVDVNTASPALLSRVAGLSQTLAENIVAYRDSHGAFANRQVLKSVPRLGAKTFEQAAGFLRIVNGDNPLDASAVHPESYGVVERIVGELHDDVRSVIGNAALLRKLDPARFTDETFGVVTVKDIISELEKPGRDPRPEFKAASFKDGVEAISDLKPGMLLEGTVTNVANFGAFVDIGVHQDGLVHISMLADRFVRDPREVVKAGDIVKVKVLEVDVARKRIALTMRTSDPADAANGGRPKAAPTTSNQNRHREARPAAKPQGAFADALAKALKKS